MTPNDRQGSLFTQSNRRFLFLFSRNIRTFFCIYQRLVRAVKANFSAASCTGTVRLHVGEGGEGDGGHSLADIIHAIIIGIFFKPARKNKIGLLEGVKSREDAKRAALTGRNQG